MLLLRAAVSHFSKKDQVIFISLLFVAMISLLILARAVDERYANLSPLRGGTLREGVIGSPRFVNPLLATSDTDHDLVNLLYAGLMRHDNAGGFEPELAASYEISPNGLMYTFHLRDNLVWHDGQPLTTEDILFTIERARNPAIRSPLRAQWEGVAIEKIDERTLRFMLPKPYAPFLAATTLGILPKHLWNSINPQEFTLSSLNRSPIGAGPYRVDSFKEKKEEGVSSYTLKAFPRYALSPPFIGRFIISVFSNEEELRLALRSGDIDAFGALSPAKSLDLTPSSRVMRIPLPRLVGVFFNQEKNDLLASRLIRQALWRATDGERIVREALGGEASLIASPLPHRDGDERPFAYDPAQAKKNIEQERAKNKKLPHLAFRLATAANPQLTSIASLLKAMWEEAGFSVELQIFDVADLERNIIRPRDYDALLFGQVVGYYPDPYAFWHSSQRTDPGLNIANYSNVKVDAFLQEARSATDPTKQEMLYDSFIKVLSDDVPAIFLYRPVYVYAIPQTMQGISLDLINLPSGRFEQVEQWYLREERTWDFLPNFLNKFIL